MFSLLIGQKAALKTFVAEGALDGLEYPDGGFRVTVRESVAGLGREVPDACRAANFSPFIDVIYQSLLLKGGEMLTHSHHRNLQPLGHPRSRLGILWAGCRPGNAVGI